MKYINNNYIKEYKNYFDGKNIEDRNIRYKEFRFNLDDEILNLTKNRTLGKLKN